MSGQRISDATRARIAQAWPDIIAALADGELVRDALEGAGISRGMLRAYLDSDASARAQWDSAREQSAHAFMEQALDAANNRGLDPAHARVRIDTLKWAARIRNPRLYGDKAQLDVNVRTVDLTRIIEAANARLAAAQVGRIIEHAATVPALAELL
jgi:hypothetical protein